MTSIVDLDPTHPQGMLGLAPGCSVTCAKAWLALQTQEFRDGVQVVAIDPSAPYPSGSAGRCRRRGLFWITSTS